MATGAYLPYSPLADVLGFRPLPVAFFAFLVGMVILYLVLVEVGKSIFYRHQPPAATRVAPIPDKRVRHRASRWSVPRITSRARRRSRTPRPATAPGR